MNLYLRYFDTETIVKNIDEALDFLYSTGEINVDEYLAKDLRNYMGDSKLSFPKRYKVRGKNYFIAIKTPLETVSDFKQAGNTARTAKPDAHQRKENLNERLTAFRPGWYDVSMFFRRVVQMPRNGKCQYFDTDFRVRLKAISIQDAYDRVCNHLNNRHDVDRRSQLPSIKGKNFNCQYLGMK